VSRNGRNYQAAFWTQGNDPATSNGPAGSGQPWIPADFCGQPTATNTPSGPTPTTQPGTIPATVSMIYADVSFTSVQAAYQATGHKYYALAFILGNNHECVPAWDGTHPMSENFYASEISAIRAAGGDVSAVFGGVNGSDMATVCTTVSSLQAAYQAVINQYQFKWIDLNVEGSIIGDSVSIDRRNKAIAALQAANPGLRISYTLPVTQSGMLQTAVDLLSNAKANGVRVDYVNIMTMNYGPAGIDMGQAAIDAAINTRNQLVGLGLSSTKLGLTPMNGQNNTYGEIFDLGDADQMINFARANSYIGWLSIWSLGRDNGGCPGQTTASASCSGIAQSAYAFTLKLKAYP
jgi:chitinase